MTDTFGSMEEMIVSPEKCESESQCASVSQYSTSYETLNWVLVGSWREVDTEEWMKAVEAIMVADYEIADGAPALKWAEPHARKIGPFTRKSVWAHICLLHGLRVYWTFGFCCFQAYDAAKSGKRSSEYRCPRWRSCDCDCIYKLVESDGFVALYRNVAHTAESHRRSNRDALATT